MNVLVTSSRLPVALDEIRKFGRSGHRVFAADTFSTAPGSHSRHVAQYANIAPPASSTPRFIDDIKQLVLAWRIDYLVPCFEEVFYLARHLSEVSEVVQLFTSDFPLLAQLHDKVRFNELARALGIPAPETIVARSSAELVLALRELPRHFAKPAFSRGGLEAITNVGPLAGALRAADVTPTAEQPWLVQEYVDGVDVCSFGVAQHGRLVLHCSYIHPRQIEHAGGVVFESIIDSEALACAGRIVAATGYHGQIGFDFRRNGHGLVALECNPRPTAGVHLASDHDVVDAVLNAPSSRSPHVVPAGVRRLYASALVRDLLLHRSNLLDNLAYLRSGIPDVYAERGDRWPALFQFLSYSQVVSYLRRHGAARRSGTTLMAAYFDGIAWDGQPIQ